MAKDDPAKPLAKTLTKTKEALTDTLATTTETLTKTLTKENLTDSLTHTKNWAKENPGMTVILTASVLGPFIAVAGTTCVLNAMGFTEAGVAAGMYGSTFPYALYLYISPYRAKDL